MTDILLRDIDEVLAARIRRVGETHDWSTAETLLQVLERGLHVCEVDGALRFADHEAGVMRAAIVAMEQVPSNAGFAMIGRAGPAPPAASEPDQSIAITVDLKASQAE